ncbi:hypothetical protein MYAM1_001819 [Malassezia yamatoensis]|uniref:Uncharacterized protein n=1 Tax=Malassezia yamatoensis TaxID=253288 RepID=A0AAJ5YWW7_9BASI|nr:hypothetical protein MYAM1_001819 [Malassezia yamatoensis]
MEALELDSELIILDEDSSASNFLVRDKIMADLVPDEPITPLVARARDLVQHTGTTVMLVCGSSSAFLSEADVVVQMDHYRLKDITAKAKQHVAKAQPVSYHDKEFAKRRTERMVKIRSLEPNGKVSTRGTSQIQYGHDLLDLQAVPQLTSTSQTRAIEAVLKQWSRANHLPNDQANNSCSLQELVKTLDKRLDEQGIDVLQEYARLDGFLARPRRVDLAAAVNRLRQAEIRKSS